MNLSCSGIIQSKARRDCNQPLRTRETFKTTRRGRNSFPSDNTSYVPLQLHTKTKNSHSKYRCRYRTHVEAWPSISKLLEAFVIQVNEFSLGLPGRVIRRACAAVWVFGRWSCDSLRPLLVSVHLSLIANSKAQTFSRPDSTVHWFRAFFLQRHSS